MKNLFRYLLIGLFIPLAGNGQHLLSFEQQEKYEALKVAFLTDELSLSSKEAQSFWPIYNEMDDKLTEVRQAKVKNERSTRKNFDSMTDRDFEKAIADALDLAEEAITIKREFLPQFQSVLPSRKVAKLYASEEKFKRKLLKKMKEHRQKQSQ
jgi:hypothetical protein